MLFIINPTYIMNVLHAYKCSFYFLFFIYYNEKNKEKCLIVETLFEHDHNSLYSLLYLIL